MNEEALEVLRQDPVMADLVEKHDPYAERDWDEFERLCISIINQQLSTASAAAVRERVFELFRDGVTPAAVLEADDDALRAAGLSRSKIEYMRNAARAFQEQDLTREGLADHSDEAVVDRLTEITGIGAWTARMYLLFVLEREDVLPLGDLAIRRGIEQLYGNGNEPDEMTRTEMREIAETWRPYRSVATRYIWAEYEADD
ncbi:DNA-3-methyladenine glycosylase 2 family protein [Natronolimnohabitans sp. A-GB9]|uniref:DNA-3-methyladenine glycosylase family protein n=1 Tax=Natronolimnohabitans sp. A-GB9 TaxID=3069757 RepID=UPI0027B4701D|nr:DNA-3-methyladenine glycosylase 2 family protein [Natronolimnohabitans sp. A-GB9]MDQ2050145.1 DNA-3-methyladenine glycosylase 2 family protein [Natronolimnohabitans sp. A-GB9]